MQQTDHRPWDVPAGPWTMKQWWHNLLFMHWALPPDALRPMIPAGLELETFDGQAWLGIVPFRMSGVRARWTPSLPWISAFPELNVRTYVRAEDKPGVYFFSLEAANPLAVMAARRFFHLPYFHARMSCGLYGDTVHYVTQRAHRGAPPAEFRGRYRPTGDPIQPNVLEDWLTARYCLYAHDRRGRLYRGEIHHLPWTLQPAEAEVEVNTMAACHGITLPEAAPLLHYAHVLEVNIWGLRRVAG